MFIILGDEILTSPIHPQIGASSFFKTLRQVFHSASSPKTSKIIPSNSSSQNSLNSLFKTSGTLASYKGDEKTNNPSSVTTSPLINQHLNIGADTLSPVEMSSGTRTSFDHANMMLCRICEEFIRADLLGSHSKLCGVNQEFQINLHHLNVKLKKLGTNIATRREQLRTSTSNSSSDILALMRLAEKISERVHKYVIMIWQLVFSFLIILFYTSVIAISEIGGKKSAAKLEKIIFKFIKYFEEGEAKYSNEKLLFTITRRLVAVVRIIFLNNREMKSHISQIVSAHILDG